MSKALDPRPTTMSSKRRLHRSPLTARNETSTLLDCERRLIAGMLRQAFCDLSDPEERDDAVLFLTDTLWADDPEGLPLRDIWPALFTEENRCGILARVRLILDGLERAPKWDDEAADVADIDEVVCLLN